LILPGLACADHGTNRITFGGDPKPSPPTPVQGLVKALEEAYVGRDLERYLSLLAEDMVFRYVDRDSNGVPVLRTWGLSLLKSPS
jgi:hypothetical protein